jgi:hypothetical protein
MRIRARVLKRPYDWSLLLFVLVRFGLVSAFALAIMATKSQFERKHDCRGSFSAGFSSGFDAYHCEMRIKHLPTGFKIAMPTP